MNILANDVTGFEDKQNYTSYTDTDHEIWQILFNRQMQALPTMASKIYLEGISKAGFVANHIPNYAYETNPRLKKLTAWEIVVVKGLIPVKDFFELLAVKKFPASTWLRDAAHLEYLEEPDMFHDTFGHIPLLTNQYFCDFLAKFSKIALKYIDDDWAITLLQRIYWFTVEFGLIREDGKLKIYGGGILSSNGETAYSLLSQIPKKVPYNVAEIMETPIKINEFQKKYFIIDSYEALFQSISTIENQLVKQLAIW